MKTALYFDHRQPESVRMADLVGRLTLDEKIGLMYFIAPAIPRLGKDLAFWDIRCKSFLVEAGDCEFQLGAASDDIRVRARLRVPVGGLVDL